jgi:DNA mismatch endonuclease (patch repair protein)
MDVFRPEKRSEVMSRIRGRGNATTELALAREMRWHGVTGWRRHHLLQVPYGGKLTPRKLQVRPDFVFLHLKLVVFVDGCFWHGCKEHCKMPTNNRTFWEDKLLRNRLRDELVDRTLRRAGWSVLRLWEHELRDAPVAVRRLRRRLSQLRHRRERPAT